MKFYFIAILSITAMLFSCNSAEKELEHDYDMVDSIVFGNVYGMCIGDCRSLYILNPDVLRADADSNQPADSYENTIYLQEPMVSEDFQAAQPILEVPKAILDQAYTSDDLKNIISDTDFYILITKDQKQYELRFDVIAEDAHPALIEYAELVRSVIAQIR